MTTTELADPRRPGRLAAMVEAWARDGLVDAGIAAQALAAAPRRAALPDVPSSVRTRRLELVGYLGTFPVAAAGLLLVGAQTGFGSLLLVGLLIAVASPLSVRRWPGRRCAPRHVRTAVEE